MMEDNRNQSSQGGSSASQQSGQQENTSSQQENVNQENPQDGEQWSNYQTRELAPKEGSQTSEQIRSDMENEANSGNR